MCHHFDWSWVFFSSSSGFVCFFFGFSLLFFIPRNGSESSKRRKKDYTFPNGIPNGNKLMSSYMMWKPRHEANETIDSMRNYNKSNWFFLFSKQTADKKIPFVSFFLGIVSFICKLVLVGDKSSFEWLNDCQQICTVICRTLWKKKRRWILVIRKLGCYAGIRFTWRDINHQSNTPVKRKHAKIAPIKQNILKQWCDRVPITCEKRRAEKKSIDIECMPKWEKKRENEERHKRLRVNKEILPNARKGVVIFHIFRYRMCYGCYFSQIRCPLNTRAFFICYRMPFGTEQNGTHTHTHTYTMEKWRKTIVIVVRWLQARMAH